MRLSSDDLLSHQVATAKSDGKNTCTVTGIQTFALKVVLALPEPFEKPARLQQQRASRTACDEIMPRAFLSHSHT